MTLRMLKMITNAFNEVIVSYRKNEITFFIYLLVEFSASLILKVNNSLQRATSFMNDSLYRFYY